MAVKVNPGRINQQDMMNAQAYTGIMSKIEKLGIKITQDVSANGIFAIVDDDVRDKLQQDYFFYPWDELNHEVRWMTSFDTTPDDIENFHNALELLLNE